MTATLRLIFTILIFFFVSKISYAQNSSFDSVETNVIASLDKFKNKTSNEEPVLFNTLNFNEIRFSLDSLNNIAKEIDNRLSNHLNLNQDNLLSFQNQILNAQEKANYLVKLINKEQKIQIDTLGLTNEAINIYFTLETLKGKVDEQIRIIENQIIKKKAGYIWAAPISLKTNELYNTLKSSIKETKNISPEITNSEKSGLLLLLLISFGYFYWLFKSKQNSNLSSPQNSSPVFGSLLFLLVLLPLFDRVIIVHYIEIIQLLTLLLVLWKFKTYVEIHSARWWIVIIILYILLLLVNYMIMSNGLIIRTVAIALNLTAIYIGRITVNRLKTNNASNRIYRTIFLVYVILNTLAVFLNIIGQVNISKTTSITAIIGATQLIGLVTLGKFIIEKLNLQLATVKKSDSFLANLNKTKIISFVQKTMFIIGCILWIIVFMINLEIIDPMSDFLKALLNKPHAFGSLTFTLGNLIYCIIILSIANWFQKNLDVLLTDSRSKKFENQVDQKGTKITLLRLAIIILGFLLGVTALGISMNKLTVILGALSVGIGLGMQNIFNNFVSGVILIFEKPFKIGDYIELADKKGKVQKIGIRSSTLLTEEGSEVIIPNGDLLSGRLVNWTHSQSYYKCELTFKFSATSNLEEIKQIILTEIENNKYSIKESAAEILYNSISATDFELIIKCWIVSIYKESQFKSSLLEGLRSKLNDNEIISLG